jgi:hypothetical protein
MLMPVECPFTILCLCSALREGLPLNWKAQEKRKKKYQKTKYPLYVGIQSATEAI